MQPPTSSPDEMSDTAEALHSAFERFNRTSAKLEEKYEVLRQETARLRAELHQKDRKIKQAEQLATLGKTAAAIAHEVRNPLGAVKLFLSLLREDVRDNPDSRTLVDQIGTSIDSIENVVSNILQFARPQQIDYKPCNMHSLLNEQIAMIQPRATEQFLIIRELQANPFVYCDEKGLGRAFYNLMLNALQATGGKGTLSIHSEDVEGYIRILLRDSGPGISAEFLTTLFDPFVTSRKEGTGLGLAIVKHIVDSHYGTIEATNSAGACFEILLPRNPEQFRNESMKESNL